MCTYSNGLFFLLYTVPTAAPSGITFNQLSQTSVEINWNPLPISGRNGNISYEASVTAHKTEEIMYSNANIREERIVVNELAPSAIYKLKIAAKSSSGIGPYASIIFAIGRKVTRGKHTMPELALIVYYTITFALSMIIIKLTIHKGRMNEI